MLPQPDVFLHSFIPLRGLELREGKRGCEAGYYGEEGELEERIEDADGDLDEEGALGMVFGRLLAEVLRRLRLIL